MALTNLKTFLQHPSSKQALEDLNLPFYSGMKKAIQSEDFLGIQPLLLQVNFISYYLFFFFLFSFFSFFFFFSLFLREYFGIKTNQKMKHLNFFYLHGKVYQNKLLIQLHLVSSTPFYMFYLGCILNLINLQNYPKLYYFVYFVY